MKLQNIKRIYFIGIGGIGMSALARYFNFQSYQVYGYDKTQTSLTKELEKEGITIHYEDDLDRIPKEYTDVHHKNETLIIFTPAIPPKHKELNYFRDHNYKIVKRSQVLGLLSKNCKSIGVAGTHGKTTISTMIAHILYQSTVKCNALLGGISKNYNSNLLTSSQSEYMVVEADEFDRSFLQLHPTIEVISSIDPDHLDIYGEKTELEKSFVQYMHQIKSGGKLFIKKEINIKIPANVEYYQYSLLSETDIFAKNIKQKKGYYTFDVVTPWKTIENVKLNNTGYYNIENTLVATAVASFIGAKNKELISAIENFEGIHRRFEYKIKTNDLIYIDDYAHHPKELEAAINSVRKLYPDKKILGIFQPHLYTRTRDFADEFAQSLQLLDELILLDIYPAREKPIEGITSKIIFDKIQNIQKTLCTKEQLINKLKNRNIEVIVTLGAGDIDTLVEPIHHLLKKND